jgi:NAD(P)-dependent dehydrogenase (short-subunit alcohol dehydrogenase family)
MTAGGERPLKGAVALVTGASRGIGAAVARELAVQGASLVLAARSVVDIDDLASDLRDGGGQAIAVETDVTVQADLDALVAQTEQHFGRLDILVNNAGVLPPARRIERLDIDDWDQTLRLNLTSAWYLATRTHHLLKRQGGVVVNVASTAAHYPSVGLGAYCVSKSAVLMLTRSLAIEWARDGIRVISISPGKVDTEMVRPILEWVETHGAAINPLGRVALPAELGRLIAMVAGPLGGYVTGCDIAFDGGEMATVPA